MTYDITEKDNTKKLPLRKEDPKDIGWRNPRWSVKTFRLRRKDITKGAPRKPLFRIVAEKLPFESLCDVEKSMLKKARSEKSDAKSIQGVYVAHDSVGQARYIGRGDVFTRLKNHKKKWPLELLYFSIYVVTDKRIERQIETMLIHIAGPALLFNSKKKKTGNETHNPTDFEEGTIYYERKSMGRLKSVKTRSVKANQTIYNNGGEVY